MTRAFTFQVEGKGADVPARKVGGRLRKRVRAEKTICRVPDSFDEPTGRHCIRSGPSCTGWGSAKILDQERPVFVKTQPTQQPPGPSLASSRGMLLRATQPDRLEVPMSRFERVLLVAALFTAVGCGTAQADEPA